MVNTNWVTYEKVEPPKIDSSFFNQNTEPYDFLESIDYFPIQYESPVEMVHDEKVIALREDAKKKTKKNTSEFKVESFNDNGKFVKRLTEEYTKSLKERNISTKYVPMLVAQDVLESGWGKHQSGKNNFGGIKGKGSKKMTIDEVNGQRIRREQEFKDFKSLKEYTDYKVDLLNNKRYHAFDGNDFFTNVAKGGYASSTYLSELKRVYPSVLKYYV